MEVKFEIPEALLTASPSTRVRIYSNLRGFGRDIKELMGELAFLDKRINRFRKFAPSPKLAKEILDGIIPIMLKHVTEKSLPSRLDDAIKEAEEEGVPEEAQFYAKAIKPRIAALQEKMKELSEISHAEIKTLDDYYNTLTKLENKKLEYIKELLKLIMILNATIVALKLHLFV